MNPRQNESFGLAFGRATPMQFNQNSTAGNPNKTTQRISDIFCVEFSKIDLVLLCFTSSDKY